MGRSKKRSSDFQKVKLKVGRSLPRGLNVTNVKFKAKKIKVPGQFRSETSEPKTRRHQTIGDLLKKAQHTCANIRHESLIDINKLLNSHKELIELHLSSLLQVSSSGFLDDYSSLRKEAVNIFCLILENVPEVKISAFSSVVLPHVCCAMTSIHNNIRLDSLKVLDLCLDAIPSIIVSSEKILKNFLSQISYEKGQVCHKSGLKAVIPFGMKTASERVKSQNWRTDVLSTLAKFLKAVGHCSSKKDPEDSWPPFYRTEKIPKMIIRVAEFPDLKEYFSDLMPILFEIWVEAAPIPYEKSDSGEVVSADAAEVMDNVLKVICLICEWFLIIDEKNKNTEMMTWFNSKYRKQIFGRLMVWFPYSQRIPAGKRKRPAETEIPCLSVNLAICDVFSMMPHVTSNASTKLYQQVTDYLLYLINCDNNGGVASFSIIVKIFKKLLATSKLEFFEPHLNELLKRFKELEMGRREREMFLDFITDLIMDITNKEILEGMPMIKQLVQSLLQDVHKMHLHRRVEKNTLAVVKQLNVIGFLPFVEELQTNNHMLIELIQSEEEEIQNIAVYLIARLTDISLEFFQDLAKAVFNPIVKMKTINTLLSFLSLGLQRPLHIPAFTGKDYANFLFCITVGMFKHDTDTYKNLVLAEQGKHKNIPFHLSEYGICRSTNLQRHFDISQAAIRALIGFRDKIQMCQCIHTYIMQFTTQCAHFPVHTGLALLLLEVEAYKIGCLPDDTDCLLCVSEIAIALFLYEIAWEQDKEPAEIFSSGNITGALLSITKILKNMRHVCEIFTQRMRDEISVDQVHYIATIMLVALRKQLVPPEDLHEVATVLQELDGIYGNDIANEPWWIMLRHEINPFLSCGE